MKITVNPHKCDIVKTLVNEKEINVTKCEFEFAEEITNDFVKDVYFTFNGVTYKQENIQNNECDIPYEVLQEKGTVEIGVVAYKLNGQEYDKRYNPSPAYYNNLVGSLKEEYENTELITPTDKEQIEQMVQDGLNDIQDKIDEVDDKLSTVDSKIDEIDIAIKETNNLDIDANKVDKTTTVEITKKDNTKKVVQILDGVSLQFMWQGTSLGIKTDNMQDYVFVDLQGVEGKAGPQGEPFRIKKTYSSVAEMNADFNNMEYGDYVMIASSVEVEDNAKLYTRGESAWIYITDFSGATGIRGETGLTPIIRIGTVTSGATPSVTRTGTDEEPMLNFVLPKGDKGDKPTKGVDYFTQSDIDSMVAEVTEDATSEFNQNVIAKTNEFNTNATNKTTDFNTNATAKTTAFNDNATQKTNEFNTNAQNKTDEFNENVEDLELRLERSEMVYNALPKVTGEGTSVTLDNTANAPMGMIPNPSMLKQETTTGKNKLPNVNETKTISGVTFTKNIDGTIKVNGTATARILYPISNTSISQNNTLLAGSYKFSCTPSSGSLTTYYSQVYIGSSYVTNINNEVNINIETDTTYVAYIVVENGTTISNQLFKPMIRLSSEDDTYEPYTGGNPAPSPEFPMQIHTISGDNEIVVGNKNLFDETNVTFITGVLDDNGNPTGSTASHYTENYYNVIPNQNYTLTGTIAPTGYSYRIYFYNNKKQWISRTGQLGKNDHTFKTPNNCYYIRIQVVGTITLKTNDVMLELGSTATDYEPHQEQEYELNLPEGMEVCKIGDYEDEFVIPNKNLFDKNNSEFISKTYNGTTRYGYKLPTISDNFYVRKENDSGGFAIVEDVNGTLSNQVIISTNGSLISNTGNDYYLLCLDTSSSSGAENKFNSNNFIVSIKNIPYEPFNDGKWYLKKNIGKVVLDGSENWSEPEAAGDSSGNSLRYSANIGITNIIPSATQGGLSNYFKASGTTYGNSATRLQYNASTFFIRLKLSELNITTTENFKTWLSTHNTTVYYVLATPTYTLLNDTLQTQLNNIQKVLAYQDQTNISQVNNDLPFTIKASAIRDMSGIFELISGTEL